MCPDVWWGWCWDGEQLWNGAVAQVPVALLLVYPVWWDRRELSSLFC